MEVRVRVPGALRDLVGGEHEVVVSVAGETVASVLDALRASYPALERRVRDELGRTRTHVNLFVGADNVRDLDGLETPMRDGDELTIIAAISGG